MSAVRVRHRPPSFTVYDGNQDGRCKSRQCRARTENQQSTLAVCQRLHRKGDVDAKKCVSEVQVQENTVTTSDY
jgi:hypothetical protein